MAKELGIDSRFEDIFRNRFSFPEAYERIRSAVEETAPIEVEKPQPPIIIEDSLLYSPKHVASMLGVKPATVRSWIREGELSATKTGPKFYRILGADIKRMLQ